MAKEMKNIIVLKNVYPNIFDEVIFVLNKDAKKSNNKVNLVNEAKKIVNDYIKDNNIPKYYQEEVNNNDFSEEEKNKKLNLILNTSLIISFILFVMLVIKVFT